MQYVLYKKLNKVDDKVFVNFYLVSDENNLLIPIEIKKIVKDKKIVNQSDWHKANATALWMGKDHFKDE